MDHLDLLEKQILFFQEMKFIRDHAIIWIKCGIFLYSDLKDVLS